MDTFTELLLWVGVFEGKLLANSEGGMGLRVLDGVAKGLLAGSLLFVLVWWWVSVWLFLGGIVLYGVGFVWRRGQVREAGIAAGLL